MKGHATIPPRVGTAPMSKTPASLADFRGAAMGRQSLPRAAPSGPGALPAKPPIAAGGKSPAGEGNGRSRSISPPPQAAPTAHDSYPEDHMYDIATFIQFKQSQQPVPAAVLDYASKLWKAMPELLSSVQNNTLRDSLFKEVNATMPSKVLVDRKLHNEVLGILGRVTEGNLERMKKELTDLPIRQSTEEEVHEVINTFFRKCTRPEDTPYTPLYVQLIRHLVNSIGEHEPAGAMIRREIIKQVRDTFLNATEDIKELEDRIAELPEGEADLERMQLSGKQKANVYFLGLLFCNRICSEMVVLRVLDNLLFGDGKRRRVVPDFCATHFMELLQTCGPHMGENAYTNHFPRYVKALIELHHSHPSKRIQILVENFLETMRNNWVPLHGRGSHSATSQAPPGGPRGANPPRTTAMQAALINSIPDPTKRIPDREEFWKVMDDYFTTNDAEAIKALVELIPLEVLTVYTSKWIGRYVTTYKYTQERGRLGELFEQLDSISSIGAETARTALRQHLQSAVDEDLFTDQPKYFTHWAAVIKGGRNVFPVSLHNTLLDMLIAAHVSRGVLEKAITDINKSIDATQKPEQKDYQPQERFRVLPALLRYHPAYLDAGADLNDEEEEDVDILQHISEREVDVEVTFFKVLCDSCDEGSVHPALQTAAEALKKSPNAAYPLLSAFFTFARYDTDNLCTTYREVLKKIASSRTLVSLLEEVYVQWTKLECPESQYVNFLKKIVAIVSPAKNDPVERLKDRLRAEHKCEKMILLIDKAFKQDK